MRVLLYNPDTSYMEKLNDILVSHHYIVDCRKDPTLFLDSALSDIYDVIIPELITTKKERTDIVRSLRKKGIHTPIMVLSIENDLSAKIDAFDQGADDYVTIPFIEEELIARLQALCRRQPLYIPKDLAYGDLILTPSKSQISCVSSGKKTTIGQKELQLLECLLINSTQVVTKEQLLVKIWGYDYDSEYNNVEVYVSFARKKIQNIGANVMIKSVRGIGYTLSE